ncbi:hypothetical protein [Algoriphagus aquimarinus]|uniref:hypothetical protein n=1 Tax=Algoriphagus aquimarinus TaxID=237018 RepID=UPI000B8092D0|nr:hypothetical protein [Algoriphagus aquimarinus]
MISLKWKKKPLVFPLPISAINPNSKTPSLLQFGKEPPDSITIIEIQKTHIHFVTNKRTKSIIGFGQLKNLGLFGHPRQ